MGTWWWLALGAVAALSLVAAVIDGGGRLGRRRRAVPPPNAGPRPGEIWWTREPLLVLVLAVRGGAARVARVTAELPPGEGASAGAGTPGGSGPGESGPGGNTPGESCPSRNAPGADATGVNAPGGNAPRGATGAGAPGRLVLPPGTVRDAPGRVTALRTEETREVPLDVFEKRAGEVDPETWDRVRHLAGG